MEFEDLQKRGQELYRQKQYEKALDCFNTTIAQGDGDLSAALDNRAATHAKLGDLQAALRDGRLMIQEEKTGCLGYLRTGKILQLLGKDAVALDIYKYGIRNVPYDNPHFKLLQGMQEKLSRRCSPPTSVDPLLVLPLELAEIIMKQLSFRQIVTLLRVSKSWRQCLENSPGLWRELDFSATTKPVTMGAVRSCIKRSQGKVTHATLHRFTHQHNDILKYITTRCKDLSSLIISTGFIGISLLRAVPFARSLTTLIVKGDCEITVDTACQILVQCSKLEHAEFHRIGRGRFRDAWTSHMWSIRKLTLNSVHDNGWPVPELYLNDLLDKIPNVRELSLQDWNCLWSLGRPNFFSLEQLQVLNISGTRMLDFPLLPSSLQKLVMLRKSDCNFQSVPSQTNILNTQLTNLTSLMLGLVHTLCLPDLQALLEPNKGNLAELHVIGGHNLGREDWISFAEDGFMKEVVSLDLGNNVVDDRAIERVVRGTPRLRYLNLEYTIITGVGVKAVVLELEGILEHLIINNCTAVSLDAVEFTRAKGVKVDFRFPDPPRGRKRVIFD